MAILLQLRLREEIEKTRGSLLSVKPAMPAVSVINLATQGVGAEERQHKMEVCEGEDWGGAKRKKESAQLMTSSYASVRLLMSFQGERRSRSSGLAGM